MKYIFYILLFIFSGSLAVSGNEVQEIHEQKCIDHIIQYKASSGLCEPPDVIRQSPGESPFVSNEKYHCRTRTGILNNIVLQRNAHSSKILRSNFSDRAIRAHSIFNSTYPYAYGIKTALYPGITKSSGRYYIYMLRRILI